MRYSIYLLVFICLGISACALTLPAEQVAQIDALCFSEAACVTEKTDAAMAVLIEDRQFEREARRSIDLENWEMCNAAYNASRYYTIHSNHRHCRTCRDRPWIVRKDLLDNNCRQVLRDYWIKYD